MEQIYFTEVFLLFCLLQESPLFRDEDYATCASNTQKVVLSGRAPNCELRCDTGQPRLLRKWATDIFESLTMIADFLDNHTEQKHYRRAIALFKDKIDHPELLPSAQMLTDVLKADSFVELGLLWSQKNKDYFMQKNLTALEKADFDQLVQESLQKQRYLEAQQQGSFAEFLADYFA